MAQSLPLTQAAFYFLRHGETEPNRLDLVTGQQDVELNEAGWRQARAAAECVRGRGIDAIYSSPLKRARATAECVAAVLGLEIVIVPDLAERNWGALEGQPRELRVREAAPPGGETSDAFARRTLAGLASIRSGTLPLVVAHAGTFRVLCAELGIAWREAGAENGRPLRIAPGPGAGSWTAEPV